MQIFVLPTKQNHGNIEEFSLSQISNSKQFNLSPYFVWIFTNTHFVKEEDNFGKHALTLINPFKT